MKCFGYLRCFACLRRFACLRCFAHLRCFAYLRCFACLRSFAYLRCFGYLRCFACLRCFAFLRCFRARGVFDREIGDVVMKICANIVKIPIMVVTSNQSIPCIPFFPNDVLSSEPIYVAYHNISMEQGTTMLLTQRMISYTYTSYSCRNFQVE